MATDPSFENGVAGASARREHDRRRANREQRIREQHPHLGGLILGLGDEPRHQRVWAEGASGEEEVAASLAKRCHGGVFLLHDRRVPRSRANIDHVAVAPSGVWVVDAKRHKGKVEVRRPLLGQAKLLIDGRDQTKLIIGLKKQVQLVHDALADVDAAVDVHGALCMLRADLPMLGTVSFDGCPLLRRKALAKRLNADGPLGAPEARGLAERLARLFPPAA